MLVWGVSSESMQRFKTKAIGERYEQILLQV